MKKILFLIHDLGSGGAEKVLVNLVNNLDQTKFDISVITLLGGGVNEQFLAPHIHYRAVFPKVFRGNSILMKLLTPKQLHRLCVKEEYDIEVSYLEGPSARVISGCTNPKTKLVTWIHSIHTSEKQLALSFRSINEMRKCYSRFDKVICVSNYMRDSMCKLLPVKEKCSVLYNTIESEEVIRKSLEPVEGVFDDSKHMALVAVGTLKEVKGFERLLKIVKRLVEEEYHIKLYLLGQGPLKNRLQEYISENNLDDIVTLLGYQLNPYKYVSKCDLYVCSSYSEGFSTAVTESLLVGTPVCTVDVSGMREMLGENNEYGVVTENNEEALYEGIKFLLDNPQKLEFYRENALKRGKNFRKENTVKAVENELLKL